MSGNNRYNTDLSGKVALLVACTTGIGLSIAKRFVVCGAKVMVCSRQKENVQKAVQYLQQLDNVEKVDIAGTVCHVSNAEHRKSAVLLTLRCFKKIDIFINNAAVNPSYGIPPDEISESSWNKILNVNVVALAMFIKEVTPHMKANGRGKIITISSASAYNSTHQLGAYAVSKMAIISLTQQLCRPLAKHNININCLVPGRVDTKFASKLLKEELSTNNMDMYAIKRIAGPDEIAGAALFLASDDSNYMTGDSLAITGGFFCRL